RSRLPRPSFTPLRDARAGIRTSARIRRGALSYRLSSFSAVPTLRRAESDYAARQARYSGAERALWRVSRQGGRVHLERAAQTATAAELAGDGLSRVAARPLRMRAGDRRISRVLRTDRRGEAPGSSHSHRGACRREALDRGENRPRRSRVLRR